MRKAIIITAVLLLASSALAVTISGTFNTFWTPYGRNVTAVIYSNIGIVDDLADKSANYTQGDLHDFVRAQARINKGMLYILSCADLQKRAQELYEFEY